MSSDQARSQDFGLGGALPQTPKDFSPAAGFSHRTRASPVVHGLSRNTGGSSKVKTRKRRTKKKSNPNLYKRNYVVVPPKPNISHLLPLDEMDHERRACDVACIVCALAKPELRTRHHCNAYAYAPVEV